MTALLATRGLTVAFGGVVALDNVDFSIAERELRCIIGPNGAGKSTFFKCITGQLAPTSGQAEIAGKSVVGLDPHEVARLGVGIKMQVPQVFNGLDVAENVWIAARARHGDRGASRAAAAVLERLEIAELANRRVAYLAHGQRQLVEFAMVVAGEPRLVLLDEPAAGMTGTEAARMLRIIGEVNRTAAVIVIEHDMQFVRGVSGRITVFNRGAILLEDDADAVLSNAVVRDIYLGRSGQGADA